MEYQCSFCEEESWVKYKESKLPPYRCNKHAKAIRVKGKRHIRGVEVIGHHLAGRDRTRMIVRIRDNFTCKNCGKTRTPTDVNEYNEKLPDLKGRMRLFDIHHINGMCGKKSRGYDSTKDLDGLITLCHRCHFNQHDWRNGEREYKKKEGNEKWKALV